MVNVHIDPTFDDEERRRRIYAGDVVTYSAVPEIAAVHPRSGDLRSGSARAQGSAHPAKSRGAGRPAHQVQARVHPPPGVHRARTADHDCARRGGGAHLWRCAEAAHGLPSWRFEYRYRLRVPGASGHLVWSPATFKDLSGARTPESIPRPSPRWMGRNRGFAWSRRSAA